MTSRWVVVHVERAELPCGLRVTVVQAMIVEHAPRPSETRAIDAAPVREPAVLELRRAA